MTQDIQLKKATLALLINMVTVDQHIAPIEEQYIDFVAKELGLSLLEIEDVRSNPHHFDLKPPQSEPDRMTILYYLLFTMRADGKVSEQEEALCYKASLRLGFNHQMMSDLIRVIKKYSKEDLPPDSLIKEIKKYMN